MYLWLFMKLRLFVLEIGVVSTKLGVLSTDCK